MRALLIVSLCAVMLGTANPLTAAPAPQPQKKPPQPKVTPQEQQRLNQVQQQSMQAYRNWYTANALRTMALVNAYRNWYLASAWRNYAYTNGTPGYAGTPSTPYAGTGSPGTSAGSIPGTAGASNTIAMDHQLQAAENTVVRVFQLPEVDEAGAPKKYTPEELKELKGPDATVIGYNAMFDDLKVGSSVRVSIARKRVDVNDPNKVTWIPTTQLTGKITKLDEADKSFTLQVATAKPRGQAEPPVMEVALDANKRPMLILILSQPEAQELAKKP